MNIGTFSAWHTQSNSKTRKEKETRQEKNKKEERERNGYGGKDRKKEKNHLKVNRVARESGKFKTAAIKIPEKRARGAAQQHSRSRKKETARSRYGGTRQRARTISIQNKINISIVMRHGRLQLFGHQVEEL